MLIAGVAPMVRGVVTLNIALVGEDVALNVARIGEDVALNVALVVLEAWIIIMLDVAVVVLIGEEDMLIEWEVVSNMAGVVAKSRYR